MINAVSGARIDAGTDARAEATPKAVGLAMSDAIHLLIVRVAEGQRLPFEVRVSRH